MTGFTDSADMLPHLQLYYTPATMIASTSRLEVARDATAVQVRLWPDRDVTARDPDWRVTLPEKSSWRDVCASLVAAEDAYAFYTDDYHEPTFPWPSAMTIVGPHTLATTMISWAWAGPPLADLVTELSRLTDQEVQRILDDLGPMTTRASFIRLIKWYLLLEQKGLSITQLLSSHRAGEADQSVVKRAVSAVRNTRAVQ